jgi:hypothetical protein
MSETKADPKKFAEYVRASAVGDAFITRGEEKRLVQDGITRFGLSFEEAHGLMLGAAAATRAGVEREEEVRMAGVLKGFAGPKGKVSKADFSRAVVIYRHLSNNRMGEQETRRKLKQVMIENGWRPRRSRLLTTYWFSRIRSEA